MRTGKTVHQEKPASGLFAHPIGRLLAEPSICRLTQSQRQCKSLEGCRTVVTAYTDAVGRTHVARFPDETRVFLNKVRVDYVTGLVEMSGAIVVAEVAPARHRRMVRKPVHLPDSGRAMSGVLEDTRHSQGRNYIQRHAVTVGVDTRLKGI